MDKLTNIRSLTAKCNIEYGASSFTNLTYLGLLNISFSLLDQDVVNALKPLTQLRVLEYNGGRMERPYDIALNFPLKDVTIRFRSCLSIK